MEQTIPARFEFVVRTVPHHLALTGRGRHWTYEALNRQANQIAHAIRARTTPGVGCVAYLLDQSPEMIVASLAALKAGKACLAMHPGLPDQTQVEIVKDVCPDLILTSGAFETRARAAAAGSCDVLAFDEIGDADAIGNPHPVTQPQHPALIFYTSGSTGQPKGVVWSHRRMMHRVWLSTLHEAITPADRQSLLRHCGFAAAQTDMLSALLQGATLCVLDVVSEGLTSLQTWIDQEQITVLRFPALLFRRFLSTLDGERLFPSVRVVSVGGDAVSPADVALWKRHFPRPCSLFLRFSATEVGVLTAARFDHDTVLRQESPTAGHPVADKELRLIDEQGQSVPAGETGELIVDSDYLADGYWRRPEETARTYTSDPRIPGRRSYRTGDLGRFLPDGRFVFLGRRDQRVKIRGFRVEIREVETALRQLDDLVEAAVVAVNDDEGQRLLAFVVMRAGLTCDPTSLRTRLLVRLPEWKVPARFHVLESLPTTLSGKVDRQRLKEQARGQEAEELSTPLPIGFESPLDPLEMQIAELWQELLRYGRVGRSDDFFLLGGDSLQATVLHLQIEGLAEAPIPINTLFKHPTVAGMATVVHRIRKSELAETPAIPPVLVPFRTTGTRPPLFLVHGGMGRSFVRPHFLEILGTDQPVYGFQASGLDRTRRSHLTIEAMAREYVRAIRTVQPEGPYLVGGSCSGCEVVIEMANQLRHAGQAVAPVLLFDPPVTSRGDLPWWRRYRRMLRAHLRKQFRQHSWNHMLIDRLRRVQDEPARSALRDPAWLGAAPRAALDFHLAGFRHTCRWHYDGPVLVLLSRVRLNRDGPFGDRWTFAKHLRGKVQWFEAGSTHVEVVGGGSELAARQIQQCVDIAREALDAMRRDPRTQASQ